MTEEEKAIYDGLWNRRDLEIQMLWTRLTLLGAFMALTYTGYGVLIIKTHAIRRDELLEISLGRKIVRLCDKLHLW